MIASLYQLYLRPYRSQSFEEPQILAKVLNPTKTVKFKENQSFAWKDVRQGLKVGAGDRLYTHNDSQVDVDFIEGPQLSLAPNTLLQIRKITEGLGLDLASGSFSTTFNKDTDYITLMLGQRKFVLSAKGKKAKVKIKKSKNRAEITVVSGQVKLKEVKAKSFSIGQILQTGTTTTKEVTVANAPRKDEVSLPPPIPLTEEVYQEGQTVLYSDKGEVPITWEDPLEKTELPQRDSQLNRYELEWSQDGVTSRKIVTDLRFQLPLKARQVGRHTIRWRVRTLQGPRNGDQELKSTWSSWQEVSYEKRPTLAQFPESGSEVVLEKPNQEVTFTWAQAQEAEGSTSTYLFEVGRDPQFKKDTFKEEVKDTTLKVPLGAAGSYFWRVKIIDAKGNVSLGRPIEIKVRPAPPPKPIKLKEKLKFKLKPQTWIKQRLKRKPLWLSFGLSLISSALAAPKKEQSITLNWPKERLAKSYVIKIYKARNSDSAFLEEEVSTNSFEWKNPTPGVFYWEVIIRDYWNRLGEPSNRSIVEIEKVKAKKARPKKIAKKKIKQKVKPKNIPKTIKKRVAKKAAPKKSVVSKRPRLKKLKKKVLPKWSFFQRLTQTGLESQASTYNIEASGIVVQSLGLSHRGVLPWENYQYEGGALLGKGKAFEQFDYWQGEVYGLLSYSPQSLSQWSLAFGPKVFFQTGLTELNNSNRQLEANQEFKASALIQINKRANLFNNNLDMRLAYGLGQANVLSGELTSSITTLYKMPLSFGLTYDSLSFETEDSNGLSYEMDRSSFGLVWRLSWH